MSCLISRRFSEITVGIGTISQVTEEFDSIQLSIFSHRFMSIAEQMGRLVPKDYAF